MPPSQFLSPFCSPIGSSGRFGGRCQHFHSDQLTDMNPLFPFVCACVCVCVVSLFSWGGHQNRVRTGDIGGATGVQRRASKEAPPYMDPLPTHIQLIWLVGMSITSIHPNNPATDLDFSWPIYDPQQWERCIQFDVGIYVPFLVT